MVTKYFIVRCHKEGLSGLLFGGLILFLGVAFAATQGQVSLQGGHPYDSDYYFRLAQQVADGAEWSVARPFAYRVGLPFLVGKLFPQDIVAGFRTLNLVFGMVSILLLYRYLFFFLHRRIIVQVLVLLFAVMPIGPLRLPYFSPVQTDPAALTFILLLLSAAARKRELGVTRAIGIGAICFVGCMFRESVIFGALVVWGCHGIRLDRIGLRGSEAPRPLVAALPLLLGVLAIALTHVIVKGQGHYRFMERPGIEFQRHWNQGTIFPLAWFNTYGPLFLLVLIGLPREVLRLCRQNPSVLLYALGILLVSVFAGSHTDRFAFWCFPAVLVMLGAFLEGHWIMGVSRAKRFLFFGPLLISQVFALRLFAEFPDDVHGALLDPGMPAWTFFSPYGEGANAGQMFAAYMAPAERQAMLLQYLGLFVLALLVLASVRPPVVQLPLRSLRPQKRILAGAGNHARFDTLLGHSQAPGGRAEKNQADAEQSAILPLDRS